MPRTARYVHRNHLRGRRHAPARGGRKVASTDVTHGVAATPDNPPLVFARDLSPFLGAPVQLTACVAGALCQYRGILATLLDAGRSGKGAGVALSDAWTVYPRRKVGEVTIAARFITNCVEV